MRARIACVVCALLAGAATSLASARLTPAEIQTTFFNGQPFNAETPSNVKFKMTFLADGKVAREPIGKTGGSKGEGTWKLDENGFCTTWKGSKPSCFTVVTSGENKWSVMRGTALMAVWTK